MPHKMAGIFFLALEKVRGRNHGTLTFGRHAAICTGTAGHIADLCRNTEMLCRKNQLFMCPSEIPLLRQILKVYCVIWVEWESLLFIKKTGDTSRVRNCKSAVCVVCIGNGVPGSPSLVLPGTCHCGRELMEKQSSKRHWFMETICGTNRPNLFSP